jgi:hypothetical protein
LPDQGKRSTGRTRLRRLPVPAQPHRPEPYFAALNGSWPLLGEAAGGQVTLAPARGVAVLALPQPGRLASASRPVVQKDRPALKPALVEQLEPRADVVRQRSLATADENRHEQQLQLVD